MGHGAAQAHGAIRAHVAHPLACSVLGARERGRVLLLPGADPPSPGAHVWDTPTGSLNLPRYPRNLWKRWCGACPWPVCDTDICDALEPGSGAGAHTTKRGHIRGRLRFQQDREGPRAQAEGRRGGRWALPCVTVAPAGQPQASRAAGPPPLRLGEVLTLSASAKATQVGASSCCWPGAPPAQPRGWPGERGGGGAGQGGRFLPTAVWVDAG